MSDTNTGLEGIEVDPDDVLIDHDELTLRGRRRLPRPSSRPRPSARSGKECAPGCGCVACSVTNLVRPRYFAGQLLTDVDLRDEQSYQIAKDRLHNRYLHGAGVVCGLQVTCDGCDPGGVVIKPGYALGPCGEDIVVPCDEHLDVIAAIEACKKAPSDCDPIQRRPKDLDDVDEHWCITLAYDEQQVTPRAALRNTPSRSCDCSEGRGCGGSCGGGASGCGCGGSGGASGCGCGGSARGGSNGNGRKGACSCGGTTACGCGPVPTRVYEPGKALACEPTRVLERYRLGVVERACATCDNAMENSQLFKARDEVMAAWETFAGRTGMTTLMTLLMYALVPYSSLPSKYQNPQQATTTLLQGKRAMWDLYYDNPLGIPCPDLATVKAVQVLDPHGQQVPDEQWQRVHQESSMHVLTLGLRYVWDYVCMKLQPPCPPDPCDDRLVIACVTVRKGRVVDVCNFSCRTRAGSFTARDYWLSLTGIKPLVLMLLERLCCGDLIRARSPIRNRLGEFLDLVDPRGQLRTTVAKDDFRKARRVAGDLTKLRGKVDLPKAVAAVQDVLSPRDRVDFADTLDRPVADVERQLDEAGVAHTVKDVDEAPMLATLRAARIRDEDAVVLLRDRSGRVAGVAPAGAAAASRDERATAKAPPPEETRVAALAEEVAQLRTELAELRRDAASTAAPRADEPTPKRTTAAAKKAGTAAARKATGAAAKRTTAAKKVTGAAAKRTAAKKTTGAAKRTAAKRTTAKRAPRRRGGGS